MKHNKGIPANLQQFWDGLSACGRLISEGILLFEDYMPRKKTHRPIITVDEWVWKQPGKSTLV